LTITELAYSDFLWNSYELFKKQITIGEGAEVSPRAVFILKDDEPINIGEDCIVRSGCVIYFGTTLAKGVKLGHDVFIRERCNVGEFTKIGTKSIIEWNSKIGARCMIEGGVFLAECSLLEDEVFMGPQSRTTSDKYMDGRTYGYDETGRRFCTSGVKIRKGAKIGAGVTVLPGVVVGEGSTIGAGCVVAEDVPANSKLFSRWVKAQPPIKVEEKNYSDLLKEIKGIESF